MNLTQPKQTAAFFVQSAISFAVSVLGLLTGIVYLPIDGWLSGRRLRRWLLAG